MLTPLVAAVVQMSSQDDVIQNLERMTALVAKAAGAGARLVVLPENFAFVGEEGDKTRHAESFDGEPGPIARALGAAARAHGIHLIAGGMPEKSDDPARPFNSSVAYGPTGAVVAVYRKVHLFD